MGLPSIGSRVSLRYRSPFGSEKPLTDVVGYLEALSPEVLVATKAGELVHIAHADIVSVRELSHLPVRTSQIRSLEHAAALGWPGTDRSWLDGWLVRACRPLTVNVNSALPLDFSSNLATLPKITDWYRRRQLPAVLALPERLLPVRLASGREARVLVCDTTATAPVVGAVDLLPAPDAAWRAGWRTDISTEVWTAVLDGDVTFASASGAGVARGVVTIAPDGNRWLGLSAIRVDPEHRRRGRGSSLCATLFDWGRRLSARRAYVEVPDENTDALAFFESLGFRLHHTKRYVNAESLLAPRI